MASTNALSKINYGVNGRKTYRDFVISGLDQNGKVVRQETHHDTIFNMERRHAVDILVKNNDAFSVEITDVSANVVVSTFRRDGHVEGYARGIGYDKIAHATLWQEDNDN